MLSPALVTLCQCSNLASIVLPFRHISHSLLLPSSMLSMFLLRLFMSVCPCHMRPCPSVHVILYLCAKGHSAYLPLVGRVLDGIGCGNGCLATIYLQRVSTNRRALSAAYGWVEVLFFLGQLSGPLFAYPLQFTFLGYHFTNHTYGVFVLLIIVTVTYLV